MGARTHDRLLKVGQQAHHPLTVTIVPAATQTGSLKTIPPPVWAELTHLEATMRAVEALLLAWLSPTRGHALCLPARDLPSIRHASSPRLPCLLPR